MFTEQLIDSVKTHVNSSPAREVCGLIVSHRRKHLYVPCTNIAERLNDFCIDPVQLADIEDKYKIVCVVHSHVNSNANPSQADLVEIERNNIPYLIMNYPLNTWTYTEPSGYQLPYVGRTFVHGITDCFSIWADYYKRELGIEFKHYERDFEWWKRGQNMYIDHLDELGMVQVNDMQKHDIILMQIVSPVPNHAAVYVDDNKILHHIQGKVSSIDVYGGWYRKITTHILRHKTLL